MDQANDAAHNAVKRVFLSFSNNGAKMPVGKVETYLTATRLRGEKAAALAVTVGTTYDGASIAIWGGERRPVTVPLGIDPERGIVVTTVEPHLRDVAFASLSEGKTEVYTTMY